MAGVVFVAQAEIEFAKRNPAAFAAPADVNDLLPVGQQRTNLAQVFGASSSPSRLEFIWSGVDAKRGHGDPILSRKVDSTRAAMSMSAGEANSAGLWLTPPRQRTNSMANGRLRSNAMASWPAPARQPPRFDPHGFDHFRQLIRQGPASPKAGGRHFVADGKLSGHAATVRDAQR